MVKLSINVIAAILSLLLSINISIAQSVETTMPRKELRINLETVMYQKLIETSNSGSSFNSRDAPSGVLSISNYYRLKQNFVIEPSLGLTIIPYNYNFNVELETDHPLYSANQKNLSGSSYDFSLISSRMGLSVFKEYRLNKVINIVAGLGVTLNLYPTYQLQYGESFGVLEGNQKDSIYRFFEITLEDKNHTKAFWSNLTYSGRVGLSKTNSNGNGYSISLVFNFQPNEIGAGNYSFNQGSYLETGSVKWKNSYYGFCFSKTFNRDKKE